MEKNCNCPECGSDRTKKAKVLYESGTSTNASTILGIKLSPPAKPRSTSGWGVGVVKIVFLTLPFFVMGIAFVAQPPHEEAGVFFILLAFALGIMAYSAIKKEIDKAAIYNDEYTKCERLWYCERCGHTFYIH